MFVLDTSALMALFLNEPGADQVAAVVRQSEMSMVNLAEIYTKFAESGVRQETVDRSVMDTGLRIRAFREAHAMEVGRLRPLTMHLGLSLGDRACLAQGRFSEMPILTTDARMAQADIGLDIRMIR